MYKLLPIYTEKISDEDYLISNCLGRFLIINQAEMEQLVRLKRNKDAKITKNLREKLLESYFLIDEDRTHKYSEIYQTQNLGLFHSASLHIFVLTLECNLDCLYCQALYQGKECAMMSVDIAKKAVDFALQSPEKNLTFEFQGGEPLMNFDVLKFIVEYTNQNKGEKNISFSLVNNGQAMDDEKLKFLVENGVSICFSIDGPKKIHDHNRPTKNGKSNFDTVLYWYNEAKKTYYKYKKKQKVTALSTVTRLSLEYAHEIIDFYYYTLGEKAISIRPISPFGRAEINENEICYSAKEFLDFYRICMDYMRTLPIKDGYVFTESFSNIIIDKIEGRIVNYPDLRSPCGAGTGQLAYNWNGKIYTCDEGRMMSNQGVEDFCIGSVENSYNECMNSSTLKKVCMCSCLESHQICSECVYHPICGICPVYNLKRQKNMIGNPPLESRCQILKGTMQYLIEWKHGVNEEAKEQYKRWTCRQNKVF